MTSKKSMKFLMTMKENHWDEWRGYEEGSDIQYTGKDWLE